MFHREMIDALNALTNPVAYQRSGATRFVLDGQLPTHVQLDVPTEAEPHITVEEMGGDKSSA